MTIVLFGLILIGIFFVIIYTVVYMGECIYTGFDGLIKGGKAINKRKYEKKERITISIRLSTIRKLDKIRRAKNRSEFIENLIELSSEKEK